MLFRSVAKYADHLPLYRQEAIYARAGAAIPRSTLAHWVGSCGVQLQPLVDALRQEVLAHSVIHADETPVQMLKPASQRDGKTHRAYLWAYTPGRHEEMKAVVYDFCESRAGKHAGEFLRGLTALSRFVDNGQLPVDNNWVENQMRPVALGRKNWLFAGSLRAGERAAAVMSLIQSARMNGHDPHAYLKDVLTRLPTQRASQIGELLPHRWTAISI